MNYPHRMTLVVADADRDEGGQLFVDLFNGDEAQRGTFSVPLNADGGSGPITHFGCSIQVTSAQRAWLQAQASARGLDLRWCCTNVVTNELEATEDGPVAPDPSGRPRLSAPEAIERMGLRVRQLPPPIRF